MRFQVQRTSDSRETEPPCDGAIREGDQWFIELADLPALLEFVRRYDRTIVGPSDDGFELEIYDDWRE